MITDFPRYGAPAVALHWIMAALILGNLAFGLYLVDLPLSPSKLRYFSWHKWVGVTVFVLAAARLAWRLGHPPPQLPRTIPAWEARLAHLGHALLYVLFFAVPLSGWLFSSAAGFQTVYLGMLPIPDLLEKNRELADAIRPVHRWLNYALMVVVAGHVLAALKHHFVDRNEVLARMLPFVMRP
jgi:cytochrome b561